MIKKRGFTLIEMIIVLAVIAVLLLILVPNMRNFINVAQRTTCQENMDILKRKISAAYTLNKATDENDSFFEVVDKCVKEEQGTINSDSTYGNFCPDGGVLTIRLKDQQVSIWCSIHGDLENPKALSIILDGLNRAVISTIAADELQQTRILDSKSIFDKTYLKEIKSFLANAGIDTSIITYQACLKNDSNGKQIVAEYYFCLHDISVNDVGETIEITKFDALKNRYYAGTCLVGLDETGSYPVIQSDTFQAK